MKKFKFELKTSVTIISSGETGKIIGRTDNVNSSDQFLIEYKAGDGRAVTDWWYGNQIKLTPVVKAVVKKRAAPKKRALKSPASQPA